MEQLSFLSISLQLPEKGGGEDFFNGFKGDLHITPNSKYLNLITEQKKKK